MHCKEQCEYHVHLMKQTMKNMEQSIDDKIKTLIRQNSDLKFKLNLMGMVKLPSAELAIQHLQAGFVEMALMVETQHATSYNGIYVWKIPGSQDRTNNVPVLRTVLHQPTWL